MSQEDTSIRVPTRAITNILAALVTVGCVSIGAVTFDRHSTRSTENEYDLAQIDPRIVAPGLIRDERTQDVMATNIRTLFRTADELNRKLDELGDLAQKTPPAIKTARNDP